MIPAKREQSAYRKIVRKTWRKLKFRNESPEMQRMLLYLWTAPDSDMPGLYYVSPGTIADDLGTDTSTVIELLRNGSANGWFKYDFEARVIFFPKWTDYDPPPNPNTVSSYMRQLLDMPDSELCHCYAQTLEPFRQRYTVRLPEPFEEQYSQRFRPPIPLPLPIPIPIPNKHISRNSRKRVDDYPEVVHTLTQFLRTRILENKPDRKLGSTWNLKTAEAIDKLIRIDKREPERVREVIEWCQTDNEPRGTSEFCWGPNILSGEKLRKQFDRLETDMSNRITKRASVTELIHEVCSEDDETET